MIERPHDTGLHVTIVITKSIWLLEAFGFDEGTRLFADKLPNGSYKVWDGLHIDIEILPEHCREVRD